MESMREVEYRFRNEYSALLQAAGTKDVRVEDEIDTLIVVIMKHLAREQTGLPPRWERYTVVVVYEEHGSEQDYTDRMLNRLYNAEHHRDQTGVIASFKQHFEAELGVLKGLTLLSMAKFNNALTLVVIVSDWVGVERLETRLLDELQEKFPEFSCPKGAGLWDGHAVTIIRDQYEPLIAGEEYLDKVLVGSRVGAGGMTCGAILKGEGGVYMLQCAHAYEEIGEDAWAPSAVTVIQAIDDVSVERDQCPPESARAQLLQVRLEILNRAKTSAYLVPRKGRPPTKKYRDLAHLKSLSVGRVETFLPKSLDSALIKLRLSPKFGVSKTFCRPANCLRPSRAISGERHSVDQQPEHEWESEWSLSSTQRSKPSISNLPDAITALSSLKKTELLSLFGKGEEKLMKFGARTGYTEFWVVDGEVLVDGRECLAIAPVSGGHSFRGEMIVERGDSSSPVVDKAGVMHGMISAKHLQSQVAYMILTSNIITAAKEQGYELQLA